MWQQYHQNPIDNHRNQLVEHYLPSVKGHAERVSTRIRKHVEIDELTSMGVFGLMEAIKRFDPGRRIKFETFASRRIVGAMYDGIRSQDHLSRGVRTSIKTVKEFRNQHLHAYGTEPSTEDVVRITGQNLRMAKHVMRLADSASVPTHPCDGLQGSGVDIEDRHMPGANQVDFDDLFEHATRELDRREKLLLKLCVVEKMTLAQASKVCGVSTARGSQLMRGVKERLRARLTPMHDRESKESLMAA